MDILILSIVILMIATIVGLGVTKPRPVWLEYVLMWIGCLKDISRR